MKAEPMRAITRSLLLFLPVLVPSWRFFDGVAAAPRIEYMVIGEDEQWIELCQKPQRISLASRIARLFYNPQWNDDLFMASCAERIRDGQIAHSEAEIAKRIRCAVGEGESFKFRIVFVEESDGLLRQSVEYKSQVMGDR